MDGLSLHLTRRDAGAVGEVRLGQDHVRQALLRLNTLTEGEVDFLGNRIDGLDRKA